MNSIKLNNVLPHVFEQVSDLQSDVWKKDVCFEKGHLYLVEAASGKGKSTFCSYVIGYRHDYTGQVVFDQKDVRTFNVNDWVNIRQKHISHLFQELRLFPELTAMENVKIKNDLTGFKTDKQIVQWFDMLGRRQARRQDWTHVVWSTTTRGHDTRLGTTIRLYPC